VQVVPNIYVKLNFIYIYIERERERKRERECFYANVTTRSQEEEIYGIKGGINMKEFFEHYCNRCKPCF
jgi:hypothetical protein